MSLAVLAAPGHNSAGHHNDTGHGHHDNSHTHKTIETAYGKPGDPEIPSREIVIKTVETEERMVFIPSNITVGRGEQIKFKISNAWELGRKIVIATEEENAKHAEMTKKDPYVAPDKNGSFVWHFTEAGKFDMSCLIRGHKEGGMKRAVTVRY